MQKDELLEQYPQKNLNETFKEKKNALLGIGTPKESLIQKIESYSKFIMYDDLVSDLRSLVSQSKLSEFDELTSQRIIFHFSKISFLVGALANLDLSTPTNVSGIFQRFDTDLTNQGFLNPYLVNANGRNVSFEKTVLDEFIIEVRLLLRELSDVDPSKAKDLKQVMKLAQKLKDNEELYEKAIQTAENWIEAEGKAISSSLDDKAQTFDTKANSHEFKKIWPWLLFGVISGLLSVGAILIFILTSDPGLTFGDASLRISILIVISYFIYFGLSQFTNNRKLYESYKFKAIALKTMEEMIKSYTDDREVILNKAIDIIFSEPVIKESTAIQKKILDESLDILKKKNIN